MPSNYNANSTAVQAPAPAPAWFQALLLALPIDTDGATTANLYQAYKTLADNATFLLQHAQQAETDYGDGSDGVLTPGFGTLNMTRDMQFSAITMGATDVINTNGFLPRVQNLFTGVAGASIHCDANLVTPGGYNGSTGTGGLAGVNIVGIGGSGGAGGAGTGGAGSTGGVVTPPSSIWKCPPWIFMGGLYAQLVNGSLTWVQLMGGAGGGGGGGGGGVAGAGGGVAFLVARQVSGAFTMSAVGGAGQSNTGASHSGGGGGGGGGAAVLVRHQNLGATITVNTAGGVGGAGIGTGGGTGVTGTAGPASVIEIAA